MENNINYEKLISIVGKSGLFVLINAKQDGIIAQTLDKSSTFFVSNRKNPFSLLVNIEVYKNSQNIYLKDIFLLMQQSSQNLPNEKDNKELLNYFKNLEPDLNFNKIYPNDFRKMVLWYKIIIDNSISLKDENKQDTIDDK